MNDVELCGETGLLFAPLEQEKIGTYFIPQMGPAPKWCAFLENLTEEMEEANSTTLYDDFKFVTHADLDRLNASHLIGTSVLKAYMHGFFMSLQAYQKLIAVADPNAYAKFKQEQIANRLKKKADRIQVQKKPQVSDVKINAAFVDELLQKKKAGDVEALVQDSRFSHMFEDKAFTRDKNSAEYKAVRPVSALCYLKLFRLRVILIHRTTKTGASLSPS